jgi:hypothetical protein
VISKPGPAVEEIVIHGSLAGDGVRLVREAVDAVKVAVIPEGILLGELAGDLQSQSGVMQRDQRGIQFPSPCNFRDTAEVGTGPGQAFGQ